MNYHSSVLSELSFQELDYYKQNNTVVFQYDINNGIKDIFKTADIIYSEPAWQKGYNIFLKRANVTSNNYKNYILSIKNIILELHKPTFLIIGKHALKMFNPESIQETVILNKYRALIAKWFTDYEIKNTTNNITVINEIIALNKFNTYLDFNCGYGFYIPELLERKNSFIFSDINKKCIYYIAKNYMGYNNEL